jgi:hypothetical protein
MGVPSGSTGTPYSISDAVDTIHATGGLFSINHFQLYLPGKDLRNVCVGCAWDFGGSLSMDAVDAVEVGQQAWSGTGKIFTPETIQWWDHLHKIGHTHVAPIGGSDDHRGGQVYYALLLSFFFYYF